MSEKKLGPSPTVTFRLSQPYYDALYERAEQRGDTSPDAMGKLLVQRALEIGLDVGGPPRWKKKGKKERAEAKTPEPTSATLTCGRCGHQFPPDQAEIDNQLCPSCGCDSLGGTTTTEKEQQHG